MMDVKQTFFCKMMMEMRKECLGNEFSPPPLVVYRNEKNPQFNE